MPPAPSTADPDSALLAGLRAHDERAFAELVERHGPALLRHARTFVHGAGAAEDVVQETWLAVVTGVERFEGLALLRTWLFAIVANRARTRAARERRSVPFSALTSAEPNEDHPVDPDRFLQRDRWPGHWAIAPEPRPDEQAESAETLALAAAAIDELAATQREVVRLRDVEGWGAAEVCETLRLSAGNQRVLLHRGRARVRAALEAHLADAPGAAPVEARAAGGAPAPSLAGAAA